VLRRRARVGLRPACVRRDGSCGEYAHRHGDRLRDAVTAALSYRRMANPAYAIDVFLSWGANEKGWSAATIKSYRRLLNKFVDFVPHKSTDEYEREDYERFISLWVGSNPSTRASIISLVNTWMKFLHKRAMAPLYEDFERPKRLPAKDLAVTRISLDDANALLAACRGWQERLCIETAVYSGFRRAALANMKRGDVELDYPPDHGRLGRPPVESVRGCGRGAVRDRERP